MQMQLHSLLSFLSMKPFSSGGCTFGMLPSCRHTAVSAEAAGELHVLQPAISTRDSVKAGKIGLAGLRRLPQHCAHCLRC